MPIEPLLVALGVAFVPAVATLAALWLGARRRADRAEKIIHELAIAPALRGEAAGPSTSHLSQAIDAIAVEVERISEGQRFTTSLLSERREGVAPRSMPLRVDTPH